MTDPDVRSVRRTINHAVQSLRNQIKALKAYIDTVNGKTQRVTTTIGPIAIGATDVTITWPQPWPDTAYGVIPTLVTGDAAVGNVHAQLKNGTKTTTDCVVRVVTTAALASIGIDVLGVRT